ILTSMLIMSIFIAQLHCLAESISAHSHPNSNKHHHHHEHSGEHSHNSDEEVPNQDEMCCQSAINVSSIDFTKKLNGAVFLKIRDFVHELSLRNQDLNKDDKIPPEYSFKHLSTNDLLISYALAPNAPPYLI